MIGDNCFLKIELGMIWFDDPHEVDDAISLEIKEGNIKNLWIHISNPCKLFLHDSNVDLDARRRSSSLYLTNQYVPMLPKDILEKANLAQNKISETISAAIEFKDCLLYTSPSPRDKRQSRMPSSAWKKK